MLLEQEAKLWVLQHLIQANGTRKLGACRDKEACADHQSPQKAIQDMKTTDRLLTVPR